MTLADLPLLLTPLLAGALVLLSHVPLGEQVLRRGIVFSDLAIAQVAALGALVTATLAHDLPAAGWVGSGLAALAGSGLVAAVCRRWPERREALIGLVYVSAAALAVLWVSADPHGAHKLKATLSGDVLWVTWADLAPLAVATALFLALSAWRPRFWQQGRAFYPCFAVFVSLSVPLLGLYLVFSSLVVPALAAAAVGWGRLGALAIGVTGYVLGLAVSLWVDLPSGACVVVALVATGSAVALGRRRRGTGTGTEH